MESKQEKQENRWNFDFLFEGSIEDQTDKTAHFSRGILRLAAEAGEDLADAVMRGWVPTARYEGKTDTTVQTVYRRIQDLTACMKQLHDDPRLKSLSATLNRQNEEKGINEISNALRDFLRAR